MVTSKQLKAARALAGLTTKGLSEISGVSENTLRAFESGRTAELSDQSEGAIVGALIAKDVLFIGENGGGAGVRLKKRNQPLSPKEIKAAGDAILAKAREDGRGISPDELLDMLSKSE